jgi:hypothetical protein
MENQHPELKIILSPRAAGNYRLELRFREPGSQSQVDPAAGKDLVFIHDQEALSLVDNVADAYGRKLSELLFADEASRTAYAQAQAVSASAGLPLRVLLEIAPDALELHNIHWEALYDPDGRAPLFIGDKVLFSRYLSSAAWDKVTLHGKQELRALVAVANPSDLDFYNLKPVDVTGEIERSRQALGSIQTDTLPRDGNGEYVTLDAIIKCLRQERYDIVYIVAHGLIQKNESYLWLENEQGEAAHISGSELAEHLQKLEHPPLLVALLACESAGSSASSALSAIGPRLAQVGIPAVLAMQGKISMASGAKFMSAFFQTLAEEGVLDHAAAVARHNVRNQPDFWMPVLYTRLDQGLIFGEAEEITVQPREIQRLNRSLLWGIAVVTLLIIGVGAILYRLRPAEVSMKINPGCEFCIAVAGFAEVGDDAKGVGSVFAANLSNGLRENLAELETNMSIAVWGPAEAGSVRGNTPQELDASAKELAERIGADILVYGQVDASTQPWQVTPLFYISPNYAFEDASEIIGQEELGSPFNAPGDYKALRLKRMNDEATPRGKMLAALTVGMTHYLTQDYPGSLTIFKTALLDVESWGDPAAKKLINLLLGNSMMKVIESTKDYSLIEQAEYYFNEANIDQQYARAYIGLGSMAYLRSQMLAYRTKNPADLDRSWLKKSLDYYNQAVSLAQEPDLAHVREKADMWIGQDYFASEYANLYATGQDPDFSAAAVEFKKVIAAYEKQPSTILKGLAAEAHARLGLIYRLEGRTVESIQEYKLALSLSSDSADKELYNKALATLQAP